MTVFDNAFRAVVGEEGGYTSEVSDPGNWTGGRCGVGVCRGTKYGISAASYPYMNIGAMTLEDAKVIYRRDYWEIIRGDDLPSAVALLVFDAAVNSGPDRAIRWLQAVLRVQVDGQVGPLTLAAAGQTTGRGAAFLAEYQAQRVVFLTSLPLWRTFGLGWSRRAFNIQLEALRVGSIG